MNLSGNFPLLFQFALKRLYLIPKLPIFVSLTGWWAFFNLWPHFFGVLLVDLRRNFFGVAFASQFTLCFGEFFGVYTELDWHACTGRWFPIRESISYYLRIIKIENSHSQQKNRFVLTQKGRLCQVDNYKYSHLSLGSTAKRSFTCFVRLNRWKDDNSQLVSPQFGNWCFIQPGQLGIPVDIIVPLERLRAHHGVLGILPLRSLQLYKIDPLLPSIQRLGPRIPK